MTIDEQLRQALAMTEAVAQGTATEEDVDQLMDRRASLIDQAIEAREAGAPWGEREARLAKRIVALDQQLIESLWEPRRDAFSWLAERQPALLEELPCLSAMAANSLSP